MKQRLWILCLAGAAWLAAVATAPAVQLNEIRIDHPGADNNEYFELSGTPGESLNGVFYIVIGDGAGGSGVIEHVTDLTGLTLDANGLFCAAEATFDTVLAGVTPNLITTLNFENSDNVTHMLVSGFIGANGNDLDLNDDGVLDATPWTSILDCVALIETPGLGDQVYCSTQVGPDGTFVPGHVLRCGPTTWEIGGFTYPTDDTPCADNGCSALAPSVFNLVYRPCIPQAGDPVQITVDATDPNNDIAEVKLFYRLSTATLFDSLTMTTTNDTMYAATIPSQADQSLVQFFVRATDLQGNSTTNPSTAPSFLRQYRVGFQSIASIQSNTVADSCLSSALLGQAVNIRGIVTHKAFEFSDDFFYVQSGTAPNSGIKIFAPDSSFVPDLGDSVTIAGFVDEFRCATEVVMFAGCGTVVGTGKVQARTLSTVGDITNEVNESMLVTIPGPINVVTGFDSTVTTFVSVEFRVATGADTAWVGDDTFFPDGIGYTIVPEPGMVLDNLTGIIGARVFTVSDSTTILRLEPRRDNDVDRNFTDVGDGDGLDAVRAWRLGQNRPNPFNPRTTIEFEVPRPGIVHLNVYDASGRLVRRLMTRNYLEPQRDRVVWDGTDQHGNRVSSGLYFYRLESDGFRATRKMLLMK